MKIYIEPLLDNIEIRAEFFKMIAEINKKIGSKYKCILPDSLIEIKEIPLSLAQSNMIPALIGDYTTLDENRKRIEKLSKIETSVKNLKNVWEENE